MEFASNAAVEQVIEAPDVADVDRIARMLIAADDAVAAITGTDLDGSEADLERISAVLRSGQIDPDATWLLQCLGLAFGRVFANENAEYDWWMVEDEYGRDPCLRYRATTLLSFPQTMLSKRVEDGKSVDVLDLYSAMSQQLCDVRRDAYSDD